MRSDEEGAPEAFPAVLVPIESGLESPGDTISRQGKVDLGSFRMGGRVLTLPDGLDFDVALTNTGDGILATGIVRGHADTACDRCLGPASLELSSELSCYYLKELPAEEDDSDEDFGLIDEENGCVDLSEAIQTGLALDVPFVVLCKDDCKGLCPVCGANLNEGDCGCSREPDPDFERPNPFAALAGYTFADGSVLADHLDELDGRAEEEGAPDEDDLSDEEFERLWDERSGADV